jgi:hypothetical protein
LQITFEVIEDLRVLYLMHFVSPQVQITRPVFISYCHPHKEWLTKLKLFADRGLFAKRSSGWSSAADCSWHQPA